MIRLTLSNLNKYLLFVTGLLLLQGAFISVLYGQSQNDSLKVIKKKTDDGSRVFIKESGWIIPNSNLRKASTVSFKVKVQDERKVKLKVTYYDFQDDIVTNEPLTSLGIVSDKIRYQKISEYKIKDKIFCYKISFSYDSSAVVSFFSYYDEDGDGKFESLVVDEIINGRSSFFNVPHIPQWLLKKKL